MSTLGITYGQLQREVGRFLGFDRDPTQWGANETQDVQDCIDAGLRQFHRPIRLPEERESYQWSFLRPYMYLQLAEGVWDYDMPEDFAAVDGCLYYVASDNLSREIQIVSESRISQLRQQDWDTTQFEPTMAAITPKRVDGVSQGSYTLMVWPKPDQAYTITFKYYARQPELRQSDDVPLGGSEHAETIRASCMAAAESHLDDESKGRKWEMFIEQLRASMDFDRRVNSPANLGYNGDPRSAMSGGGGCEVRAVGSIVQYTKYPLTGGNYIVTQDGKTVVSQE